MHPGAPQCPQSLLFDIPSFLEAILIVCVSEGHFTIIYANGTMLATIHSCFATYYLPSKWRAKRKLAFSERKIHCLKEMKIPVPGKGKVTKENLWGSPKVSP